MKGYKLDGSGLYVSEETYYANKVCGESDPNLTFLHPPEEIRTKSEWKELFSKTKSVCNYSLRSRFVQNNSWCILTKEVAEYIGDYIKGKKVVEVFAGTGYIANQLRKASGLSTKEYRAYDNYSFSGTLHFGGVVKKNAFRAPIKKCGVVVMTWPNYNVPNAYKIARKMVSGQVLIYNGEGWGGCTGCDKFHEYLEDEFDLQEEITNKLEEGHISFSGIHDYWCVYIKR